MYRAGITGVVRRLQVHLMAYDMIQQGSKNGHSTLEDTQKAGTASCV